MNSSTSFHFHPPLVLSLICMVLVSYPGLPLLQSYSNSLSYTLLCSLSLYLRSPSLYWLSLSWSLINLHLVSSLCLPPSPLLLPLTPCLNTLLSPHHSFSHAVALLRPGHKVAVGDIVKVTNGQHLPADMVIVSSRSDCVLEFVCVCLGTFMCVCLLMYMCFNHVFVLCYLCVELEKPADG